MAYVKPYRFEVINQEEVLINSSTGIAEYKIESIDGRQLLVKVSALKRDDRISIPVDRIEGIEQQHPEDFI